jgi:hypothetical protein
MATIRDGCGTGLREVRYSEGGGRRTQWTGGIRSRTRSYRADRPPARLAVPNREEVLTLDLGKADIRLGWMDRQTVPLKLPGRPFEFGRFDGTSPSQTVSLAQQQMVESVDCFGSVGSTGSVPGNPPTQPRKEPGSALILVLKVEKLEIPTLSVWAEDEPHISWLLPPTHQLRCASQMGHWSACTVLTRC